jgi:predicted SprT family Zn-dependent metalloprotease
VITEGLTDDRFMAITDYDNGYFHIGINPKFNLSTKTERINLIHEMCHIRGFVEHDDEFDQHGMKWQACMHSVADQNGFNDLW